MRIAALTTMLFATTLILAAGTSKTELRGRIIAYRPGDRVAQLASMVRNQEVLLFEVNLGNKTKIVKINYQHFGESDITEQMLHKSPVFELKAKRTRNCDQSYKQFVDAAPSIRDSDSGEVAVGGVRFVGDQHDLPPGTQLVCFTLSDGDLHIVK